MGKARNASGADGSDLSWGWTWGWNGDSCAVWGIAITLGDKREKESRARLIAAAPDLLWALRQIISDLPERRDWLDPDVEKTARAAIAKAQP